MPTEPTYDPWRAAEARHDLTVALTPLAGLLGGGFSVRRHGRSVIAIDPALDGPWRTAALAHELVHDERGGLCDALDAPAGWAAVVTREERAVDREVVRRLAPRHRVVEAVRRLTASEGHVTAANLAAELDLPDHLASLALAELAADPTSGPRPARPTAPGDGDGSPRQR